VEKYLLDSNILIQAHRMHYPFDVVPNFWNKLENLYNKGLIISIDKVKKEICDSPIPDELAIWCLNKIDPDFFVDTSFCIDVYVDIANWTHLNPHFMQSAKDEFLSTDLADPWLISYAKKQNCVIVTHEVSQPTRKNRIKIPEPCVNFGVRYISPIQMFRELGETF
jgi:hypothetical protein